MISKTRFAPSPTGLIHMGNARTALFSALLAKNLAGSFLLRIEDTDAERSQDEYTQALMRDLVWIDCRWDEGPEIGGEFGPYWQSERETIYQRYYDKLEATKFAYPCFCSEEQLAVTRKVQLSTGRPPRYPGTCRHLSAKDIETKIAAGEQAVLRFHVKDEEIIEFEDMVKGAQKYYGSDIGDFVIRRANGGASFMFTNAIDDSLMQVTHVLRGEDHLTNTPRQLLILRALNMPEPRYGHISLIVGADNSPLSKRHGSKSLRQLREDGWLPTALLNYMARLGHYYSDNHFMTFAELAEKFNLENLSKSPAKFDPQQMRHWQKEAIMQLSDTEFWQWMSDYQMADAPRYEAQLSEEEKLNFVRAIKSNVLFPSEAWEWFNIFFEKKLEYTEEAKQHFKQAGVEFFDIAIAATEKLNNDLKAIAEQVKTLTQKKGKDLFMPLRFALTGVDHGPDFVAISALLNRDAMILRLKHAREFAHV